MNADYNDVKSRLSSEKLVQKILIMFLSDGSFASLEKALAQGDWETAFRAAHTLKGIALNLSLTPVIAPAVSLTDDLRGGAPKGDWKGEFDSLKSAYLKVCEEIEAYKRSI